MDLFSGLGWTLLILTGIRALEAVKRLNQTKEDLVKLMDDTVSSADKIKLFIGENTYENLSDQTWADGLEPGRKISGKRRYTFK
jgi:hypothetical protein